MRLFVLLCLLMAQLSLALTQNLFRRDFSSPVDTLEIAVLRVQFTKEEPNNSKTTGDGTFDSDQDTVGAHYSLDPQGKRSGIAYWNDQIQRAADYFAKASRGKVVIRPKIYPSTPEPYKLPKSIIDYNRTAPNQDEKMSSYDSSRANLFSLFIRDAIRHIDSTTPSSPFDEVVTGSRTHRIYLIAHAGALRLVDGGTMGTQGANTPGDFLDFYVDTSYFRYMRNTPEAHKDTLGIVLNRKGVDTLKQVLSMSETASQDKINWGISGMLIHQIGRAIGMPVTYDGTSGVSKLGQFDVMDFAGANAGNGFFPVLPSAWVRAYMGWEEIKEARPNAQGVFSVDLWAATDSTAGATRILKIPLSADEYLLLENRQRTHDSTQMIRIQNDANSTIQVPNDSLSLFFRDSISQNGKSVLNDKKGSGVITQVSHLDAALPGVGVAVWKINESIIRENLPYGAVNLQPNKLIQDRFPGITLIEADGLNTMGKAFPGRSGGKSYDYGSGSKLFPQIHWQGKLKDTITQILPTGYASTVSALGANTGIKIQFSWPQGAALDLSRNSFSGDSVATPKSRMIQVKVLWNTADSAPKTKIRIPIDPAQKALNLGANTQNIFLASDSGRIQVWNASGQALGSVLDTIQRNFKTQAVYEPLKDTMLSPNPKIPLNLLSRIQSQVLGTAQEDSLWFVLTRDSLVIYLSDTTLKTNPIQLHKSIQVKATQGPWLREQKAYWIQGDSLMEYHWATQKLSSSWIAADFQAQSLAFSSGGPVLIGKGAKIAKMYPMQKGLTEPLKNQGVQDLDAQFFRMAISPLDGTHENMILVGSMGTVALLDENGQLIPNRLKRFPRGQKGYGARGDSTYADSTDIAVADLNQDGFNDLIFTAVNQVFAVDKNLSILPQFPWIPSRGSSENLMNAYEALGHFGAAPAVVQYDNQNVILLPSASGNLYGVDAKARTLTHFPLHLGGIAYSDSTKAPWWNLNLNQTPQGITAWCAGPQELVAFDLPQAKQILWNANGANLQRSSYLSAATPQLKADQSQINQLIFYPNPTKSQKVSLSLDLGRSAQSAQATFYSSAASEVWQMDLGSFPKGTTQIQNIQLPNLGTDVYSVLFQVVFDNGEKAKKWFRLAVIR